MALTKDQQLAIIRQADFYNQIWDRVRRIAQLGLEWDADIRFRIQDVPLAVTMIDPDIEIKCGLDTSVSPVQILYRMKFPEVWIGG